MRPGQCTPILPDPFCLSNLISQRYPAGITIVRTSIMKQNKKFRLYLMKNYDINLSN